MLKKWTLGMALFSVSLFSQANVVTDTITGADMAGIKITAFFADDTQSTQTWGATSATGGGVDNGVWSLNLDGDTFGDYDASTDTFHGLWTLSNLTNDAGIVSLSIDAGVANVYFDILEGTDPSTPGSNAGRPFASDAGDDITASFAGLYSAPDLYGLMNIMWDSGKFLASGESLGFLTDTDGVSVPEPSTMFSFAIGLIALTSLRRKNLGK